MNIPKYTFPDDVYLLNLGDVHRGDNACDLSLYRKAIRFIRENENVFWCSTGDLLNVATKDSKSGPYHSMNVTEELDAITLELAPIADKCLGLVESNHHDRVSKSTGLNLDKEICHRLSIPYLGAAGLVCITCGRASYYVALHHGNGGGRTMGAKANAIQRLEEVFPCADLYMEGHTHTFLTWKDQLNVIDRKRIRIGELQTTYSVTGHYIDYFRSYAPKLKLKPKPKGSSLHRFKACGKGNQDVKDIEVTFWQG